MSETPADQAEDTTSTLIQSRLRRLFDAQDEDRPPYTEAEVARELTARGHPITDAGIRNLLRAPRINPKASTLRALASFFQVPVGYLLGEDEPDLASREARVLARSFERLTPRSRRNLARVINNFLELEEAAKAARDSGSDTTQPGA
ncbi:hypothetical protein ACFFMR_29400 [Micromonospora andamanensis]|uniref:HTH cro/C1-type domain-containing protein n=1 Tax=Micromonospora andamanensis TaxID=1287068 RepID=A0ABQ4HS98_9ACTN|nr:hypothetical protein [Micromonospora andamanensis]GIJ08391.1 hypothetical protein Van01_16050 [Micromonospora andamanensis]